MGSADRISDLLPRVRVRTGIPHHVGRGILHVANRADAARGMPARVGGSDDDSGEVRRRESSAERYGRFAIFHLWPVSGALLFGIAMGVGMVQPDVEALEETIEGQAETTENLAGLVDQYQCDLMFLEPRIQIVLGKGFKGWPQIRGDMGPSLLEWCGAGKSFVDHAGPGTGIGP